jgi:DNA-binding HxlR family transcriptional regulator
MTELRMTLRPLMEAMANWGDETQKMLAAE